MAVDERMEGSAVNERSIHILLVEDNPADVALTEEALQSSRVLYRLSTVGDGQEALDFLRCRAPFEQSDRPDLILLDLNMPRMDGREFLSVVKQDASLREIPVVVLTTSKADEDVVRIYKLQANAYITKPVDFDQFIEVVQAIEEFWLNIVELPPDEPRERAPRAS